MWCRGFELAYEFEVDGVTEEVVTVSEVLGALNTLQLMHGPAPALVRIIAPVYLLSVLSLLSSTRVPKQG